MNVKTENALARSAAPMESRPEGSSHALMRIIPNSYGPRDDHNDVDVDVDVDVDDNIDDLGSPEAPPPEAPSALAPSRSKRGRG